MIVRLRGTTIASTVAMLEVLLLASIIGAPMLEEPGFLATAALLVEAVYFGWLLAIGLVSNSLAGSPLKTQPLIATVTYPYAVLYIGWFAFEMSRGVQPSALVALLHLQAMGVNFFLLWFASRSVHASESTFKPTLSNYLATLVLLWFAPLFPPAIKWTHERVQSNLEATA
jgi:hypothetical protein